MALFVHLGIGCAARKTAKDLRLGACVAAAFAPDIALLALTVLGVPFAVNWSHGLVMVLAMSLACFLASLAITKNAKASLACGLLVISHWVVDFVTWPLVALLPDTAESIPVFLERDSTLGLGLYAHPAAAYPIEALSLAASCVLLAMLARERNRSRNPGVEGSILWKNPRARR